MFKAIYRIKKTGSILIMVLMTVALIFFIGGCGAAGGDDNNDPEYGEAAETSTPEQPIVDELPAIPSLEEAETDLVGSTEKQADTVFSITGDGVETPLYFSLEDLKRLEEYADGKGAYVEQTFSMVNNWPTKKFVVAKGANINVLLSMAGLKQDAGIFHIETAENYYAIVTREQLLGKRFCYPNIMEERSRGAIRVEPMVAWAWEIETVDTSKAKEADLRFFMGQLGMGDPNAVPSVQNVVSIKALMKSAEKWSPPAAVIQEGTVTFSHEALDQVKLHYTIDGVRPNHNSPVYNPSATYLQPELILPIKIKGNGKVKVLAIGYGKENSDIVEYNYSLTE
ncbi:hypothetical protein MASR2M70_22480 [Bacillota bacterium]